MFLLLIGCTAGWAQPVFDVVQLAGQQSPEGAGAGVRRNEIRYGIGQASIPVTWNSRHTTVLNPLYERRDFFFGNDRRPAQAMHNGALLLNHRYVLADTTRHFLFAAALRHYAEVSVSPSGSTLTPALAILYGKQYNDHFTLRLGAYYSREFFGNFWLPLVGFDWQASPRLWCWGILPRFAVADYALSRRLHACFFYKGTTDSYRVNKADYFVIIEGQARIGLEYYLPATPLVLTMDAGHSAARQFLSYDARSRTESRLNPANGWLFRAGLQFRIITRKTFFGPQRPSIRN